MIINAVPWDIVLLYFVTALFLYVPCLIVYRLYLHPLAKFPGPRLAAITRYYEAYYDVVQDGQYTFKIAELHRKYGPIVRISPYELHVNDASFLEKLYRHEGRWDKYDWMVEAFGVPNTAVTTVKHDLHKQRRAPLNSYFSKAAVVRRQDIIHGRIAKLHNRIDELVDTGAVFDVGTALSALTTDVATEYIYGKSYDNLSRNDFNESMAKVITGAGDAWRITKHVRFFGPLMQALPPSLVAKMNPSIKSFFDYKKSCDDITGEIMAEHSSRKPGEEIPRSVVAEILDAPNLPPSEKAFVRICDEVQTIVGAGFETTAVVLRFLVYSIYSDNSKLSRLRAELRGLDSDREISFAELENLPYMNAVAMEGLRMRPGVVSRTQRISPDRALSYGEWVIPPGTPVGMTSFHLHHNEKVFKDPYKFEPERWLDKEWRRKGEKSFAPFSRGTRMCLGMQLAWAELYLVVYMIVMNFDLEFVGTTREDVECDRDRFVVGTKSEKGVKAVVTRYQHE